MWNSFSAQLLERIVSSKRDLVPSSHHHSTRKHNCSEKNMKKLQAKCPHVWPTRLDCSTPNFMHNKKDADGSEARSGHPSVGQTRLD